LKRWKLMNSPKVTVVGAGLAGCEAAWQLDRIGIETVLCDIKPDAFTPAHHDANFGELVCSNSLKSMRLENACGLLKEEMRRLGSLTMEAAENTQVAAGDALAVDRVRFAAYLTQKILASSHITTICKETDHIPDPPCIIATGPLTTDKLARSIDELLGQENLYFYDAASPIIESGSINKEKIFLASRYGRGADYINCPMTESEYRRFCQELMQAEAVPFHDFEDAKVFEGCVPIEVLAGRGFLTMAYGPLKPKGLIDPKTGKEPFAVVQLRCENSHGTLFNLVGFQTRLKQADQKRIFSMIPGLENAVFTRYGVMHRNTYINSPGVLAKDFSAKRHPGIYFAGQLTGVEGYVESAASGMTAGIMLGCRIRGIEPPDLTQKTMIGALSTYISSLSGGAFQPMNANFGIMEPLAKRIRNKAEKYRIFAQRSLDEIERIKTAIVPVAEGVS
jgi:methylenetetrahydrofolate--tRNA-(uracil-5-)-methyltransferase